MRYPEILKIFMVLTLLAGVITVEIQAAEITTEVVYVTSEAVYVNAGSLVGIKKGDLGSIQRDGETISQIEVVFVAEKTSSCKLITPSGVVQIGDKVSLIIEDIHDDSSQNIFETDEQISSNPIEIIKSNQKEKDSLEKKSRLRGKIGLQYYYQDDLEARNYDYSMPSLTGSIRVDNLLQTDFSMNVRFRARRYYRNYETSYTRSDWNNRIYEVSLSYHNALNPLSYSIGRVLSRQISGIGTLDGALLDYDITPQLKSGIFAGGQPDLENTSPQFNETKAGVFLAFENEINKSIHSSATVALAGKYNSGDISKEFMYEQLNLNYKGIWGIYQSSEIGLNRGWRKEAEGNSLTLSNVLLNLRYTPTRKLMTYVSYDTRKLVRTWETKETPDSLFDDSYREGIRVGLSLRLPSKIYLSVRSGIRNSGSDNNSTNTYAFSVGKHDILETGIRAEIASNFYKNCFSKGYQPTFRVDKTLFGKYYTAVQIGQNNYELNSSNGEVITNNWLKLSMDSRLTKRIYVSAYTEFYRGDSYETNVFMIESGYRF